MSQIKRPSHSTVAAYLALFVALGSGSFAVAALSGSEKRVVKRIATKRADLQITKRAPGLSVEHAGSADSATSASNAVNASMAADSELLDGMGSAAFLGVGDQAADSELLDGQDSSDFLPSAALRIDLLRSINASAGPPTTQTLFTVGPATVTAKCFEDPGGHLAAIVATSTVASSTQYSAITQTGSFQGVLSGGETTIALVPGSGLTINTRELRTVPVAFIDSSTGEAFVGEVHAGVNIAGDCVFGMYGTPAI